MKFFKKKKFYENGGPKQIHCNTFKSLGVNELKKAKKHEISNIASTFEWLCSLLKEIVGKSFFNDFS